MPYDRTGGSIRVLLNLASPFRLLYILQMIESFLAEGDKGYLCHSPQVSDWALQFLYLGGAEHLVYLTEYTIKTILLKSMEQETKNDIVDGKRIILEKRTQIANVDAAVLTLGLLYRTLHRLLLFDPEYGRWQVRHKVPCIIYWYFLSILPPTLSSSLPLSLSLSSSSLSLLLSLSQSLSLSPPPSLSLRLSLSPSFPL